MNSNKARYSFMMAAVSVVVIFSCLLSFTLSHFHYHDSSGKVHWCLIDSTFSDDLAGNHQLCNHSCDYPCEHNHSHKGNDNCNLNMDFVFDQNLYDTSFSSISKLIVSKCLSDVILEPLTALLPYFYNLSVFYTEYSFVSIVFRVVILPLRAPPFIV